MWKPIRDLARVVKARRNARYGVSVFAAIALVTGFVVAGSSTALADDKPTTDAAPSVSLGAFSWDCNAKGWAIGNTVVTNNEDVPLSIGATSPIDDITAQTVAANSGANFGFVTDLSDVAAGQVTVTASWTDRTGPDFTGTVDYSAKHCDPMVAPTVAFTTHVDGLKVTVDKTVTGTNPTASWQWGDGTDSPGSATSHTYAKAGTYSITLTAFNDAGSDSVTHDVTVKVKDTEPTCVDASKRVLSHTWDKTIGRGTVTLAGSLPLCKSLYIVGAAYQYDTPATTGQWPQTLLSYSDAVVITEPGTYNFATPQICGQRDVYAKLGKAPKPSETLTGPNKPYEPPFLSNFSQGPATYGHDNPKDCVPTPPPDVCPNIDGSQSSVPDGMIKDDAGNCVTPPPDVCKNIDGVQVTVPAGMVRDENGNCNTPPPPPIDVCKNLPGNQSSVPAGMVKDSNGNCLTPPAPDVCKNLDGPQTSVPDGMIKDDAGNCVTPPVVKCPADNPNWHDDNGNGVVDQDKGECGPEVENNPVCPKTLPDWNDWNKDGVVQVTSECSATSSTPPVTGTTHPDTPELIQSDDGPLGGSTPLGAFGLIALGGVLMLGGGVQLARVRARGQHR